MCGRSFNWLGGWPTWRPAPSGRGSSAWPRRPLRPAPRPARPSASRSPPGCRRATADAHPSPPRLLSAVARRGGRDGSVFRRLRAPGSPPRAARSPSPRRDGGCASRPCSAVPAGEIARVEPDVAQECVGRVGEHVEVAALGHVAVVVDPLRADDGRRAGGAASTRRPAPGCAWRASKSARLVLAQHLACCVACERSACRIATRLSSRDALELAHRQPAGLLVRLRGDRSINSSVSSGTSVSFVHGQLSAGPNCAMKCRMPPSPPAIRYVRNVPICAQRRPGAVADRVVDLAGRGDAVVHEPERLAPERFEQAVGDEAVDLRAHDERLHAERRVERHRALDGFSATLLAGDDLDERQQVDRVERMTDDEALGVSHVGLQPRRQETRRATSRRAASSRRVRVELGEQLALERLVARARSPG